MLKIYKLSQTVNSGYDTYDSCVVIAENEKDARNMTPDNVYELSTRYMTFGAWVKPEDVIVEFIGYAKENEVSRIVCSSFNAG